MKPFVIARDLTQRSRQAYVIDFFPRTLAQAREEYPSLLQWIMDRVKPERDLKPVEERRCNWWLFTRPIPRLRKAIASLSRYIVAPRTAKWATFQFVHPSTIPDTSVVAIVTDDSFVLGVLSSLVHRVWAWTSGGRLGVGNDPRYQHQRTFNPFPFPSATAAQSTGIRTLGEDLDAHRKRQQAAHDRLTLTGMYNVLEKLRTGEPLDPKERVIHEQGLVSILKQLHDELDLAVLEAYGWGDLAPLMAVVDGNAPPATAGAADREEAVRSLDEALLGRLVALNAERAAEKRRGLVRWLRPEFQKPESAAAAAQDEIDLVETLAEAPVVRRRPWPKSLTEQVSAVTEALAAASGPVSEPELAARFSARGPWRRRLGNILEMLVTLGRARQEGACYRAAGEPR